MSGDMTPTAVANQVLDACGVRKTLSDIESGTDEANVILRAYRQNLQQLLRAAHWNFARRVAPLMLLADASGATADVGNLVQAPWLYAYRYPSDCLKARFVPLNPLGLTAVPSDNIQIPTTPIGPTGLQLPASRLIPARFLIGTDANFPAAPGVAYDQVQGVSPAGSTVVMTNVQNAQLVYTANIVWPSLWDAQFRQALVAMIASNVVLRLQPDVKVGRALRTDNIAIAMGAIKAARISDGNEAGFSNTDHTPDWLTIRNTGGMGFGGTYGASNYGVLGYGYDAIGFADGSGLSASAAF